MLRCRCSQTDGVAMLVVATSFVFVVSIANVSAGRRVLLSSVHLHHHHHPQQQQQHNLQQASMEGVGVVTTTTTTTTTPETNVENFEKNIVASPIKYAGRHVCSTYKNVTTPVQTKLPYCKPIYKRYTQKCSDHQMCRGVRLVYETAYKNVITSKNTQHVFYYCCPGWGHGDNSRGHGCNKPKCSRSCQNGGTCVKPDLCSCPKGFNGLFCEKDVDECKEQKPCDQICHNTPGSFECQCRENFTLLADGQSCRKDADDGTSFEAKELEYGHLDKRIQKLEEEMNNQLSNDITSKEIEKLHLKVENLDKDMDTLKKETEVYKNDLRSFKNELYFIEKRIKKVDEVWKKGEFLKKRPNLLLPHNSY